MWCRVRPRSVAAVLGVVALAAACSSGGGSSAAPTPTVAASEACAAGGEIADFTMSVPTESGNRTAIVHPPEGATGKDPLPVVLSFHGAGETAEAKYDLDGMVTLADEQGFVVVYPQGLVGDAGPISGVTGWDIEGTTTDEPAFVAALLDTLGAQVCIDESKVVAAGISNGGGMALLLGCALPERIAVVAAVEPAVMDADCPDGTRVVPTIVFHGLDDQIVPFDGSVAMGLASIPDVMEARAFTNGCKGDPTVETVNSTVERTTWNVCAVPTVLYTLQNHGHAWPGHPLPISADELAQYIGDEFLTGMTADEFAANLLLTNNSIDATALIWEFAQASF